MDSVRRTLTLAPDPLVPADRVLSVGKTNGTTAEPARFTIEGDGTDAHLSWLDREITTQRRTSWRDELTARRQARRDGRQAAPPSCHVLGCCRVTRPGEALARRGHHVAGGGAGGLRGDGGVEGAGRVRARAAVGAGSVRGLGSGRPEGYGVRRPRLRGSKPCSRLAVSQKTRGSRPAPAGHSPWPPVTFGGKWQEIFAAIWRGSRAGWTCACRRACRPGQAYCSDRPSPVLGFWVLSRLRVSDTGEGHRHRPGDAASLRTAQLRVNSRARRCGHDRLSFPARRCGAIRHCQLTASGTRVRAG